MLVCVEEVTCEWKQIRNGVPLFVVCNKHYCYHYWVFK
jgi:hypothetical protein